MSEVTSGTADADFVFEALPDPIVAALEVRDRWFATLPRPSGGGLEFVAADLQAWRPGQTVRVAFLGGNTALHRDIEIATKQITEACNINLDFGVDETTGSYRTWSESDTEYAAEIRVSFDRRGYWSLVGTDSIDANIADVSGGVGGRPSLRSLNLGGFDIQRPATWEGTARHEFMHALAFHHEHQNFRGPCEADFRWEDDPGYVPTLDMYGRYGPDDQGRRPGIYTFLAGAPNRWPRWKVDHNLRTENDPASVMSAFDPSSVMLYRFPPLFYKTEPSPCAPAGDGQSLSVGDVRGLVLLYGAPPAVDEAPGGLEAAAAEMPAYGSQARRGALRSALPQAGGLESAGDEEPYVAQARRILQE